MGTCEMCGLPPTTKVQSPDKTIGLKPEVGVMARILNLCETGRYEELNTPWNVLDSEIPGKPGVTYLDTSDGLGFLGWISTLSEVRVDHRSTEYLESAMYGRHKKIEQDYIVKLRSQLFDLCGKVSKPQLPPIQLIPASGPKERVLKRDVPLNSLKDLVKTAIVLADLRRSDSHDSLWCSWFDQQPEHQILTKAEHKLFRQGITEDDLRLEMATVRSRAGRVSF